MEKSLREGASSALTKAGKRLDEATVQLKI